MRGQHTRDVYNDEWRAKGGESIEDQRKEMDLSISMNVNIRIAQITSFSLVHLSISSNKIYLQKYCLIGEAGFRNHPLG